MVAVALWRFHKWFEERGSFSDGVGRNVAVAAQLDVDPACVADLPECAQDRSKIHRPFTKHQVFVDALDHILDMDVHDPRSPLLDQLGNVAFIRAMGMAEVEGQLKERVPNPGVELTKALESIDEHTGLGLESQRHVGSFGMVEQPFDLLGEPIHTMTFVDRRCGGSRPERDRFSLEDTGQVDRPAEKILT
jgi:hypothetical protein